MEANRASPEFFSILFKINLVNTRRGFAPVNINLFVVQPGFARARLRLEAGLRPEDKLRLSLGQSPRQGYALKD